MVAIDEGVSVNREPVISPTGLIAWSAYSTNEPAAIAAMMVWKEGAVTEISEGHPNRHAEHIRPSVWSNAVVWGTSYEHCFTEGQPDWVLIDVPKQDEPYPELPAQYEVIEVLDNTGGGTDTVTQVFQLRNDMTDTNLLADGSEPPPEEPPRIHRHPSGDKEILFWPGTGTFERITRDGRNDIAPTIGDGLLAWQKAKGFPFGWEIMVYENGERWQITTNYYYDMGPQAYGKLITWYGWDGEDFEILLYDHAQRVITQVTDNRFDDESPRIWGESLVWEGFPAVEPDIYFWSRPEGKVRVISRNLEEDINPRIWEDYVVWQTFDGDDYELMLVNAEREEEPVKLTQNAYDDVKPEIRDGFICWMGYVDSFDAEIFVTSIEAALDRQEPVQLTDNVYEDQDCRTAGGRVVWWASENGRSPVYVAVPR